MNPTSPEIIKEFSTDKIVSSYNDYGYYPIQEDVVFSEMDVDVDSDDMITGVTREDSTESSDVSSSEPP